MSDNCRTNWYRQKLYDQWLCNPLQNKCAVNATTGKTSYDIRGVTTHSLLKLPVGPGGNKDLTDQSLCTLQGSLNDIKYILIGEYSMLGQTIFGWIDRLL